MKRDGVDLRLCVRFDGIEILEVGITQWYHTWCYTWRFTWCCSLAFGRRRVPSTSIMLRQDPSYSVNIHHGPSIHQIPSIQHVPSISI
jgi:hypothetical protein